MRSWSERLNDLERSNEAWRHQRQSTTGRTRRVLLFPSRLRLIRPARQLSRRAREPLPILCAIVLLPTPGVIERLRAGSVRRAQYSNGRRLHNVRCLVRAGRLCPSELSPRREGVPGKGGYALPGNLAVSLSCIE